MAGVVGGRGVAVRPPMVAIDKCEGKLVYRYTLWCHARHEANQDTIDVS